MKTMLYSILWICIGTGCSQSLTSSDKAPATLDSTVSNNLERILLDLKCSVNDGGLYPRSFSAMVKYDEELQNKLNKASAFDLDPNCFICPGIGTRPGTTANIDDWTDYIYVGNSIDYVPGVVLIISPPENHHEEYGYVATGYGEVMRLPPGKVRELIAEPWLLATNESTENINKIKRNIDVNVPLRLRAYYTNVNSWVRPP